MFGVDKYTKHVKKDKLLMLSNGSAQNNISQINAFIY